MWDAAKSSLSRNSSHPMHVLGKIVGTWKFPVRPRDSRVLGGSARPGLRDSPMSQLHRQGLHPPVAEASRVLRDVSLSPNDPPGIILRHLPGDSDGPPGAGRLRRLALPEPPFCSVCCKFLSPVSWPQPGQADLSAQQRPDSDSRTRDVHRPQTTSGHPPGPGVGGWPTVDRGTGERRYRHLHLASTGNEESV